MTHHTLDVYPIPRDKQPLYVNEQWLIDKTYEEITENNDTSDQMDNVRIYVPLDLNKEAILRRLDCVIAHYGEVNEGNEMDFQTDVEMIINQLEIYDQVHYVRHMPDKGAHSLEGIALAEEFIKRLENIPDGCAECFPFELIDEMKKEWGREKH